MNLPTSNAPGLLGDDIDEMKMMLSRRFADCLDALRADRLEDAHSVLQELSLLDLQPSARALFDYLVDRASFRASDTSADSIALDDIGVVLLMTEGDGDALTRSIRSIVRVQSTLGVSVHCLLLETLPASADVNALQYQKIDALPQFVRQTMQAGTIDYVVDHGTTRRGLRRAVRCSRGRQICLLREGDELWLDTDHGKADTAFAALDVAIGIPSDADNVKDAFNAVVTNAAGLRAIPATLAVGTVYDSAILVNRDYFDDLLGSVHYDGDAGYFGYLNEILTMALSRDSGKVGFARGFGCRAAQANLARHVERIRTYTLYCIGERRKSPATSIEESSDTLIGAALHLARTVLLDKSIPSYGTESPEDALRAVSEARLPSRAALWVRWVAEQFRHIALAGPSQGFAAPPAPAPATPTPVISFVSSLFRGQRLVHSFLGNITSQTVFPEAEFIIVLPEPNLAQDLICEFYALASDGVRLRHLDRDPGIYECWNIAIREARGRYVSNANLDDRREPRQAERLIELMETTGADVASAAVAITHEIADIAGSHRGVVSPGEGVTREVWFNNHTPTGTVRGLKDFFLFGAAGEVLQCMNFPHCMPVWRRDLHLENGYFDEAANGTYADFAFWLKVGASGGRFNHLCEPLGLYFVDPASHNRRNAHKVVWQSIVRRYLPTGTPIGVPDHVAVEASAAPRQSVAMRAGPRFNFGQQIQQNFGKHRSGWAYVLAGLGRYHDPDAPTYCDAFIEKKFVWGGDIGDGGDGPVIPYSKPWIGFVHVPPIVPSWFQSEQSNQRIFSRRSWQRSMEHCRGLFTLTDYHRRHLERMLDPDFPISVLRHPTEFPEVGFDFDRYQQNPQKRIVQIGWWLRKLNAISKISVPGHIPTLLGKDDWSKNLVAYSERRYFGVQEVAAEVDRMVFLDNDAYDELLAENLVFIDFYDTSANNAVIECIARGTPIVVCRHPAVEEYLGRDYPLYYDDYSQVGNYLLDKGRLLAATQWLKQDYVQRPLYLGEFLNDFRNSAVARHALGLGG